MFIKLLRRFGSVSIALAIAGAAIVWIASGQYLGSAEPETRKGPAQLSKLSDVPEVRVATQTAEPRTDRLRVQGRTQADRKVVVQAQTHGRIEELLVDKGDLVDKGQVLAQLAEEDRSAQLREAKALLEQRQLELEVARRLHERGHRSDTQLAGARAAFEEAQARVEQARTALDNTTIYAPFAGRVGETMAEVGDFMTSGRDLLRLVDLDPLKIVGSVNERRVAQIETGTQATAELITGEQVTGTVDFVAREANDRTRTFEVEMRVANPEGALRDGVTAQMTVPLKERVSHFVSPSILTLNDAGQVGVKVLDDDNRVHFQEVDILADKPDGVWITGLPKTVTFVTLGQNFVTVGQQVKPVAEGEVQQRLQDTPLNLPTGGPGKPGPEGRP
ncbi:efflux RND transporter periplasmic adaptor subunit [Rhodovibrio salinarum]|uniref:Efflux RND transporter periplasmic adaptor subunit n=1 Tax=Rhodovibrio salinarum TaxID=1087 RepID=A0A934QFG1_9PROT|nr:efflux RND transporter periplasmic adaptor subunit [Rhodovibrio salinarum]MBK1695687.1 efflux RND transporter periplasmic adaptor subunit [Rhodovibrio salinarum]